MKKSWIIWSVMLLLAVLVHACKDDDEIDEAAVQKALLEQQIKELEAFLKENNITAVKSSRGIFQEVVVPGTGTKVLEGDVAVVHYKFSLLDGTVIAASSPDQPVWITRSSKRYHFPNVVGYGLEEVNVGGTYRYYTPSVYGFRKYSDDKIPENSNIILEYQVVDVFQSLQEIYDVELEQIHEWLEAENLEAEDLPGGLHKVVLNQGNGAIPESGDSLKMTYKGYLLNKEVFDQSQEGKTFDIQLGTTSLIKGFTQGIRTMQVGEKAMFVMPSELAYGNSGGFVLPHEMMDEFKEQGVVPAALSSIPPFSTLVFEIELKEVKKN